MGIVVSVLSRPSLILASKISLLGSEFVRLPIAGRRASYAVLLLKIDGWSAQAGSGPVLVLTHKDDTTSTFPLAPNEEGYIEAFLDTGGRPIKAAYISGLDGESVCLDRLKLRALSGLSFVWRAMRKQPQLTLVSLVWGLIGKRVRASNRLKRIVNAHRSIDEAAWFKRRQPDWDAEVVAIAEKLADCPLPKLTVVSTAPPGSGALYGCESTFDLPPYPNWELIVAGYEITRDAAISGFRAGNGAPDKIVHVRSVRRALERATGGYVVILREGDRLSAGSLWRFAEMAQADPDAAVLYGDHTVVDSSIGHRRPALSPVWNFPYFISADYVGAAAFNKKLITSEALDTATAAAHSPEFTLDRLILHFAETLGGHRFRRTPRILSHQCAVRAGLRSRKLWRKRRLEALTPLFPATIGALELDPKGRARIRYAMAESCPPPVSVIIPTRDRHDLLKPCVDGLLHRTDYPSIEILIVDNGSTDPLTLAYLERVGEDPRVRVLHAPGPFNFAAINNLAVRSARGELLAFLNNDIEVIEPDWLWEMAAPAMQPEIGAVGAKLLYPSGRVQHAGVIIGLNGLAGHAHRFFPETHPGYMMRLQVPHYLSAVTAACLVVSREKFFQVEGFDELRFPIALNDVDLCLKLRERGLQNLWTPYATLLHKESASRDSDYARPRRAGYMRECAHFKEKWPRYIADDPCYHPELTRAREDFTLNDSV